MKNTNPCITESLLYQKHNHKVICNTCERRCEILASKLGFCKTRKNINGKLYTLEYGDISSYSANPIEKKPFFHFYPGTLALTVGSWSCNFICSWCQNWDISKQTPILDRNNYISPEQFLKLMEYYQCQGTSISFNEPTLLLEYALEVFDLAKKRGYYNTYVTNGYMTSEALELLIEHGLNAMNIDIKGDEETVKKYCGADVNYVFRNAGSAKKKGVHIEITTLVIPSVNDSEESLRYLASRIKRELDNVVWHVTRYYPAYEFKVPSTPIKTLERAREIGIEEGLKYVYIGNVPGHKYENTWCPNCGELLIKRYVFSIIDYKIKNNKCPKCGELIPIVSQI